MRKSLVIPVLVLLAACKGGEQKVAAPEQSCYLAVNDRDTVSLMLTTNGKNVSGALVYDYFEKDKNTGNIKGVISGDTLIAEYSFQSEGLPSIREVAFLRSGNDLVEGFGPVEDVNGKTIFSHRDSLVFNKVNQLTKVACK